MKLKQGKTIWFTGLPGSGKTTLSCLLKNALSARGISAFHLDGDALRGGLNRDLGFSALDRAENIRRAAEICKMLSDAGHVVIAAFITPLDSLREAVRRVFDPTSFVEVFLDCPLSVCEDRDPKGMYRRARLGEIRGFTGVSDPFETPCCSDLRIPTGSQSPDESLACMLAHLDERFPDLRVTPESPHAGRTHRKQRKTAVIGLDGVPPSLVFGPASEHLPNIRSLMEHGIWGALRSTDPPITIPAWAAMTTGKDPGELGIYGFRNRRGYGYEELTTANASDVQALRVWQYLEAAGKTSTLLGVPQTFPVQPHNGITVAGFPFPDNASRWIYPEDLADRLTSVAGGEYMPDVKEFRTQDKDRLLKDIYAMVERRFRTACHLLTHRPWDFFMMVEIAPDRMHHGFWRYSNADHRLYEPGNQYESAIVDFYQYLDMWIGTLLGRLDDDVTVFVVSDHGGMTMSGGIRINEWLIRNGFLTLLPSADKNGTFSPDMIDWDKTKVWSEGGYYARIFLNVQDREPRGTIAPSEHESFRNELAERLRSIPDENGAPMNNVVLKPESLYRICRNTPPDLMVYFDDLAKRSIGTVGPGAIHVPANDTGPDDANHSPDGIFIATRMSDLRKGVQRNVEVFGASYLDVTPTLLHEHGLSVPSDLSGKIVDLNGDAGSVVRSVRLPSTESVNKIDALPTVDSDNGQGVASAGFTAEEEEIVKKRLMELGYI